MTRILPVAAAALLGVGGIPAWADQDQQAGIDARQAIVCDGVADAAEGLRAALAALPAFRTATVRLPAGICRLRTPVVLPRAVTLHGEGWNENGSPSDGTWLLVDDPSFVPITVTGVGGAGVAIENLAVSQKHAPPAPGWTPTDYPPVFGVRDTDGGVFFRHIMLRGVNRGIDAYHAGRLNIDGLYGQVFTYAVNVDKSYDVDRYRSIHIWPYWSQHNAVLAYTQANTDAFHFQRVDTPYLDRVFAFGVRSGLRLGASANDGPALIGGSPTKVEAGTLNCDFTRWCIWVEGSSTFQVGNLSSQGEAWPPPPGGKLAPLPGAAAIQVDGSALGQVGNLWTEVTDFCTVCFSKGSAPSQLQIGRQSSNLSYSAAASPVVSMLGAPHGLSWGVPPLLLGVDGHRVLNLDATGIVYQPAMQSVH